MNAPTIPLSFHVYTGINSGLQLTYMYFTISFFMLNDKLLNDKYQHKLLFPFPCGSLLFFGHLYGADVAIVKTFNRKGAL